MRGRAAVALGLLLAAWGCNALTGVADLGVCDGDCSADDAGLPDRDTTGGDAAADAAETLPPTCDAGEKRCTGTIANTCTGDAWTSTPCSERCVAGSCAPYPSCANDAGTGCGVDGVSCCATGAVPSSTYNRRNDVNLAATVSGFDLELFEVTVGRFRAFLGAGGVSQANPPAPDVGANPHIPGSGWQSAWNVKLPATVSDLESKLNNGTWTPTAADNEHKPIVNVSWLVAFAFCAWDGARLPTYAEWSLAAVGGNEQRFYPWSVPATSQAIDYATAVYNCGFSPPAQSCGTVCTGCDINVDVAKVGSLAAGKGRWNHFDLGGNAEEWLLDTSQPLQTPCIDCAQLQQPNKTNSVVVAGGSWNDGAGSLDQGSVHNRPFDDTQNTIGFRCAR